MNQTGLQTLHHWCHLRTWNLFLRILRDVALCFELRTSAETAIPLCAHMVVYFEDAIPPAYIRKAGKWSLAQGVGPKDLEVKLPFQLPAGQFKTLLPPTSPPLRPPCWPKKGDSHQDLPEKWQARRLLLAQFFCLVSCGWSQVPSESEEFRRAPRIGQVLPCVSDMLVAAEEAFEALGQVGRPKSSKAGVDAACRGYVKVPLLAVEEAILPMVDSELASWERK